MSPRRFFHPRHPATDVRARGGSIICEVGLDSAERRGMWRETVRTATWFLFFASALAILGRWLDAGLVDDAYIFLQYARNLALGHGLVFNVGERVEGFTSPLWTALLGLAAMCTPHLEDTAVAMGLACGAGTLILLGVPGRRRSAVGPNPGNLLPWALTLGLLTSPTIVFWSASGLDTALFTFLVTATLRSASRDKSTGRISKLTGGLLSLATLARPEGVLLAFLVGAWFVGDRSSRRLMIGYASFIGLMVAARFLYYGDWLPNTYRAKVVAGIGYRIVEGSRYLGQAAISHAPIAISLTGMAILSGLRARRNRRVGSTGGRSGSPWSTTVVGSVPTGARSVNGMQSAVSPLWGAWIALWIAYVMYAGGDNFGLFRMLMPIIPALYMMTVASVHGVAGHSFTLWPDIPVGRAGIVGTAFDPSPSPARFPGSGRSWRLVPLIALGTSNALTYGLHVEGHRGDLHLTKAWAKTGQWLAERVGPEAVIATCTPGAIAYFSRKTTIDMLGLTDRHVARDGETYWPATMAHARFNTDYLFDRAPDYVVYHSSGRFTQPVHADPSTIDHRWGHALFDFVSDPRCAGRYNYRAERMDDGTMIELQCRRTGRNWLRLTGVNGVSAPASDPPSRR